MNDLTPALLRQLREIAAEWDRRPDPDPATFVMRSWSGGASPAGGYWATESGHDQA